MSRGVALRSSAVFFFFFVFFAMNFLRHACRTRWYPMSLLLLHIHFVLHLAVQCENETEYKCCMATFFLHGDALSVPQGVLQWSGTVLQQHRVPAQLHRSHGKGDARLQTMWVSLFFSFFCFFTSLFIYAHVCSLKELDSPVSPTTEMNQCCCYTWHSLNGINGSCYR